MTEKGGELFRFFNSLQTTVHNRIYNGASRRIPLAVFESFKATDCFYISPSHARPARRSDKYFVEGGSWHLPLSFSFLFFFLSSGEAEKSEKIQTFDQGGEVFFREISRFIHRRDSAQLLSYFVLRKKRDDWKAGTKQLVSTPFLPSLLRLRSYVRIVSPIRQRRQRILNI